MWERVQELSKIKGYSIKKIETDVGFSNGSLKKINEKTECGRLYSLAKYFGVSMEYLITGTEYSRPAAPTPFFPADEQELLDAYRKFNDAGKASVRGYMEGLMQNGALLTAPPLKKGGERRA